MDVKKFIYSETPAILTFSGIAGFIAATIMAAKAAPEANHILKEKKEASKKEKIVAVAPVYAPTVGMILLSTGCILASSRIMRLRYGALMALYSVSQNNIGKLQDAILSEVGKKKAEAIRLKTVEPDEPPTDIFVPDGHVLIQETYTGRWFTARSVEDVRQAVNTVNELAIGEGWASLNELYFELGLSNSDYGNEVGWSAEEILKVRYDAFLKDNRPVVSMSFEVWPRNYTDH